MNLTRRITTVFALSIALLLSTVFASTAYAEGVSVGPNCALTWDAPADGPVDGYKVFVGPTETTKTERASVTDTRVSCADLALLGEQQHAHVVAYNIAGDSEASTNLPFVLVSAPPGAPDNLRLTAPR